MYLSTYFFYRIGFWFNNVFFFKINPVIYRRTSLDNRAVIAHNYSVLVTQLKLISVQFRPVNDQDSIFNKRLL